MARQQIDLRTFARELGATKPLARKNAKPEPAVHKIKQIVYKFLFFILFDDMAPSSLCHAFSALHIL